MLTRFSCHIFSYYRLIKKHGGLFIPTSARYFIKLDRHTYAYLSAILLLLAIAGGALGGYIYYWHYHKSTTKIILRFDGSLSRHLLDYMFACSPPDKQNSIMSILECGYKEAVGCCTTHKVFAWNNNSLYEVKYSLPTLAIYHKESCSHDMGDLIRYNLKKNNTCFKAGILNALDNNSLSGNTFNGLGQSIPSDTAIILAPSTPFSEHRYCLIKCKDGYCIIFRHTVLNASSCVSANHTNPNNSSTTSPCLNNEKNQPSFCSNYNIADYPCLANTNLPISLHPLRR